MPDFVASLIRTYVPIAVSAIVAWLTSVGLELPEESAAQLALLLGALAGAIYYAVVRLLEKHFPWIGNFLGVAKAPVYVAPDEITPANRTAVVQETTQKIEDLYTPKTLV